MELLLPHASNSCPLTVLGFLERAASVFGDSPSLLHTTTVHTWSETHSRCLRIASTLSSASLGINRGQVVSVIGPNVPSVYELQFAVPMSGAVLNNINPRLDAHALSVLLRHSESKLVFVDHHSSSLVLEAVSFLPKDERPRLVILNDGNDMPSSSSADMDFLDTYEGFMERGDLRFKWVRPKSEWTPMVLNYTSGTTSSPKGVVHSHRSVFMSTINSLLDWSLPNRPVYLWTLPMFHANGWSYTWATAAVGARNICVTRAEIYVLALSVVFSLIVVKLCHWVYQWSNPKCKGKLPPGSMGFPIIGETFEFMTPFDISLVVSPYLKKRISRYGSKVFRTSLFGAKVIVSIDPDVNMEIAKASSQLRATESVTRIFGENNPFLQSKEIHKYVRNLTSRFVGPEGLKTRLIHDIDNLLRNDVENGARNGSFDVREATIKMVGELIAKKIMGETESEAVKELGLCWSAFRTSWFQFSYNIPGTTVYRLVKARRKAAKLLKALILKKKASKEGLGDFLDIIFDEMEKDGTALDIDKAVNLIFVFFILSQETTPGVQGAVVKLVADHPSVMEELQREHEAIVQNRADKDTGVTWEEYKSMTFTHMVIKESLRFTSTQPTVHRIPDQDVQIGDYTLPAGWLFFGIPQVHFDEEKYDDPLTFNPWRWQGKDINSTVSREYMPFGAGGTHCVGSEFAKLIIAILLHHLSRFRWSLDPKTEVLRRYTLVFPAGCVVHISKESE